MTVTASVEFPLKGLLDGPNTRVACGATRYATELAEREGLIQRAAKPKDSTVRGQFYKLTAKGKRRAKK